MSVQDKMTSFFDKLAPTINKLGNNIYLRSISNTMMGTIGPLMVGSIAVLFLAFPIQGVKDAIAAIGLTPILAAVNSITIGGLALYVVFLMAKNLVSMLLPNEDGTLIGALALMSFLIITPLGALEGGGNAIPTQWLGASGVFSAFIVAIISAKIYELFVKKHITIKMPDSVPSVVTKSFDSLLPAFAIGIVFIIIRLIFQNTSFGNLHQFIYSLIQTPLQGLGTSLPATLVFGTVAQLLWFFGIHGTNVINPLVQPLRLALDAENMAALAAGQALPHIIGNAFWSINTWGATTLGLILLMLRSKSSQYREMGKIALVPGILGITEPLVFGLPLVFNFSFFFPYIFNNVIIILLSYFLTSIGIIARCSGVQCIFGLPLGFHAMVGGHWTIVVWQIISQLVISPVLWYPWFKMAEKKKVQEENEAANLVA
ncbi:MAG: PTS sugar transporter subunit IIC [Solobacterium sp.]|nr:PTS sugar transporter subunit IIC [Solobacterium sp.]